MVFKLEGLLKIFVFWNVIKEKEILYMKMAFRLEGILKYLSFGT